MVFFRIFQCHNPVMALQNPGHEKGMPYPVITTDITILYLNLHFWYQSPIIPLLPEYYRVVSGIPVFCAMRGL
jgi:hypothetical protein